MTRTRALAALTLAGCNQLFGLDEPVDGPALTGLHTSRGTLEPAFAPGERTYRAPQSVLARQIRIVAGAAPGLTLTLDGMGLTAGEPSAPIVLGIGERRTVTIAVSDGDTTASYAVELERGAAAPTYTRLVSPAPEVAGGFGAALALDGDTLAIGAPGEGPRGAPEDCGGPGGPTADGGRVHVFGRAAGGGGFATRGAPLASPPATRCGRFGGALALRGDRLVVGSSTETHVVNNLPVRMAGAVYAYRGSPDQGWTSTSLAMTPAPAPAALFGYAVAVESELIAVGSHRAPDGANADAGAVYLYAGAKPATYTLQRRAPTAADAFYGQAIALDESTLVVGAPGVDPTTVAVDAGEVSVYGRVVGGTLQQVLTVGDAGAALGSALALRGDRLALGAPGTRSVAGAAWLYRRAATWVVGPRVMPDRGAAGDRFGGQVALLDDLIAVSACGDDRGQRGWSASDDEDDAVENAGVVYLYRETSVAPALVGVLAAPMPEVDHHFGCSLVAGTDELVLGGSGATVDGKATAGEVWVIQ